MGSSVIATPGRQFGAWKDEILIVKIGPLASAQRKPKNKVKKVRLRNKTCDKSRVYADHPRCHSAVRTWICTCS